MGDFGLATTHQAKASDEGDGDEKAEAEKVYDAIENISGLLGGALLPVPNTPMQSSAGGSRSSGESMTCGVGTTYYRAPEQEANTSFYTFHADISVSVSSCLKSSTSHFPPEWNGQKYC
jgi:serine/threonine protein kinase